MALPSLVTSPKDQSGYQQADFDRAIKLLDEVDWKEVLLGNVDQMWSAWEENFMSVMHQCIPTAKLSTV